MRLANCVRNSAALGAMMASLAIPLVQHVGAFHHYAATASVPSFVTTSAVMHRANHNHLPRINPTNRSNNNNNKKWLQMSTSSTDSGEEGGLDVGAVARYIGAVGIEMGAFAAVLKLADFGIDQIGGTTSIPLPVVGLLAYAASLKSRVFNPLNNSRPNRSDAVAGKATAGFNDRNMPSFTPPGVVFPIMWILIIAPLRAYSTTLVFQATATGGGTLFCPAIMALVLHLSIGDVWNTINNTERRLGASVLGVLCVWCSAVFAATQYYAVDPLAGKLLGATCIWLTVASTLITTTWLINPVEVSSSSGGKVLDKLYPVKSDKIQTKFVFEE
jgi:benzodiazapine receptor